MFSVSRDSGDLEAEPRSRQLQDTAQVGSKLRMVLIFEEIVTNIEFVG